MANSDKPSQPKPLTRRGFLQRSSSILAGTVVATGLSVERTAWGAAGNARLKLALVGCGGRGTGAVDQALNTEAYTLVAMADAFKDRLETCLSDLHQRHAARIELTDERKFVGFDAYRQAIGLADVVILASPPGFRPIHFEEAVTQGKHVFMEKPLAVDGPGVRRVLAAGEEASRKNLKVVVGLQRRYQPGYIETIKRLRGGAIGDMVAMRCYWNGSGVWVNPRKTDQTEMQYQMRNWYYFSWLSGDHIVEQHIHNLDVINWAKNSYPVECQGMGGRQVRVGKEYGEIFDHHAVEYRYADESRLFSYCRHIPGCWNAISEHLTGTKGSCDVSDHRITGEQAWSYRSDERVDAYQQEQTILAERVLKDQPINDTAFGAKSTLTAIMGRMATYSGKRITWEQALNSTIDLMPKVFAWDATPPVVADEAGRYPVAMPGKTVAV